MLLDKIGKPGCDPGCSDWTLKISQYKILRKNIFGKVSEKVLEIFNFISYQYGASKRVETIFYCSLIHIPCTKLVGAQKTFTVY